jgi:hypothetical protein
MRLKTMIEANKGAFLQKRPCLILRRNCLTISPDMLEQALPRDL